MKKIDLYEIAIKILGLYLILNVFFHIQILVYQIFNWLYDNNRDNSFEMVSPNDILITTIMGFLILLAFTYFLIFKTKNIAKLICKQSDFEEEINISADKKTIYELSLVLLGLITIVAAFPDFIRILIERYEKIQNRLPISRIDNSYLIITGIKAGIGFIAIFYSAKLASLFAKKVKIEEPEEC